MTLKDMSWYGQASCEDMGPDIFFSHDPRKENFAKFICSLCPVRKECLRAAMRFRSMRGVWGGYTYEERVALRRKIEDKRRLRMLFDESEEESA